MIVRDGMQTLAEVPTLASSARSALDLMLRHGLRVLPVVDTEHRVVGVVRDHALLALAGAGTRRPESVALGDLIEHWASSVGARDAMSDAVGYFLEDPALEVLAVVEHGRLCGLLTRRAAMRVLGAAGARSGRRATRARRDAFAPHRPAAGALRGADSSTFLG